MTGILGDLQAAREALDTIIGKIRDAGATGFAQLAAPIFDAHPELESFRWTQYTPYFNDGDECSFGVNSDYVDINDTEETSTAEETGFCINPEETRWSHRKYGREPNPNKAAVAIGKLLRGLGDEALRAMFGDHVEITVTRNQVKVERFDHD
jgi:hypothetical protein